MSENGIVKTDREEGQLSLLDSATFRQVIRSEAIGIVNEAISTALKPVWKRSAFWGGFIAIVAAIALTVGDRLWKAWIPDLVHDYLGTQELARKAIGKRSFFVFTDTAFIAKEVTNEINLADDSCTKNIVNIHTKPEREIDTLLQNCIKSTTNETGTFPLILPFYAEPNAIALVRILASQSETSPKCIKWNRRPGLNLECSGQKELNVKTLGEFTIEIDGIKETFGESKGSVPVEVQFVGGESKTRHFWRFEKKVNIKAQLEDSLAHNLHILRVSHSSNEDLTQQRQEQRSSVLHVMILVEH